MSTHPPSTDVGPIALRLKAILERYRSGARTPETFLLDVKSYADVLHASVPIDGQSPSRSEVERLADDAFFKLELLERPTPPGWAEDKVVAELLKVLHQGGSTHDHVKEIGNASHAVDCLHRAFRREYPSTKEPHAPSSQWLRRLAIRATCLHFIGSYSAAITDSEFGLQILDQLSANIVEPTQATRMILSAILARSKLKMGDVHAPFDDAIEYCCAVIASDQDQANVVTDMARFTMASLTSTRDEVNRALRLPLGLERLKALYGLSPACIDTFSDLFGELSTLHQYDLVASAFERWVASTLPRELFDLPESFAPAPGFPIDSISDGSSSPPFIMAEASETLKSLGPDVVHDYISALYMQDRSNDAEVVAQHAAGMDLPFDEYEEVNRALHLRSEGDRKLDSGDYHAAPEAFKSSLKILHNCRLLEDEPRRLLTATLNYKIGKCLTKQRKFEDAVVEFRKCLDRVPHCMNALWRLAPCYRKLEQRSRAKKVYQIFVDTYKRRDRIDYPNVRGITFPNRVTQETYQRMKAALASLEKQVQGARRIAAGPPPPPPSLPLNAHCQPPDEPLKEHQPSDTTGSHPTRPRPRPPFNRNDPDQENDSAIKPPRGMDCKQEVIDAGPNSP